MHAFTKFGASLDWKALGWAAGSCTAAFVLGLLISAIALRALASWAGRTQTVLDDHALRLLRPPLGSLAPLALLWLVAPLTLAEGPTRSLLQHGIGLTLIAAGAWLALRVVSVVEFAVRHRLDVGARDNLRARSIYTQVRGFRNIARFAIGLLAAALMLMSFEGVRQFGVSLLASAGVAGIIIGFAAQRSIATVVAGVQIALTQPIRVDDVVVVQGEWGRIEEINLTYVVVRIWDLRRLVLPITYFIEQPFQNWTRTSAQVLGTVELYVDYAVPVEALRAELTRIAERSPLWDQRVCGLQVTDTNERTLTLRALVSAEDSGKAWDLRCEVREKLVSFLQRQYPEGLPRVRAEVNTASVATSHAGAAQPPGQAGTEEA